MMPPKRVWLFTAILLTLFSCVVYSRIVGLSRSGGGRPNPGIQAPWRFAYITDAHVSWVFGGVTPRNAYHLGRVVDTLNTIGIDFMVFGGDWAEDTFQNANNAGNVDSLNAIFGRARFPIWPVLGNHEAWNADTLAGRDPYYTAIRRDWFSSYFSGNHYYAKTWKNLVFVALQNNANYNVGLASDYRMNNPTTIPPALGGIQGYDYDGITNPGSAQRVFLRNTLAQRNRSHWLVVAAHRAVYGPESAATNRLNFKRNLRTTHYVKEVEDALLPDERCLFLEGDKHVTYITAALRDSALAGAGSGGYHVASTAAGGLRVGDTTSVPMSAYDMYVYSSAGADTVRAKASTSWLSNLPITTDPDGARSYTWQLFTVYGDVIRVDTYRTFGTQTPSSVTRGGKHRLIDSRTLSRDTGTSVVSVPPDVTPPSSIDDLAPTANSTTSVTLGWTEPGDDGASGRATSHATKYSTSSISVRGRVNVVANGSTYSPANSPYCFGNFAQAVGAGSGSYAPLAAATKLLGQEHPMLYTISGGTNPVTVGYSECLSSILGACYQHHTTNGTFTRATIPVDGALPLGGFGLPTGAGTIVGNLASRSFERANVYVNLSTSVSTSRPGGTLAPSGYYVNWTGAAKANGYRQYPRQGGWYIGNLTALAIDTLASWSDVALIEANINGQTDGIPTIATAPRERINRLRKAASFPITVGGQLNGFNIFVGGPPNYSPSVYHPLGVRLYHKANAVGGWVMNSTGTAPLRYQYPSGVRVQYYDITNTALRTWLAANLDSLMASNGTDYLFLDQIESSLDYERTIAPSTNWPSNAAWAAGWVDFFSLLQANIPAPVVAAGPTPLTAGASNTTQVSGLADSSRYYFTMTTTDDSGNVSGVSNVASDTTAFQPSSDAYDAFNQYCLDNFRPDEDAFAHENGPGFSDMVTIAEQSVHAARNSIAVSCSSTGPPTRMRLLWGTTNGVYTDSSAADDRYYNQHMFHATGLTANTTYYLAVRADVQAGGQSLLTIASRATTTGAGQILVPGNLSGPPYVLDTPGGSYLLTADISAQTRAISIKANNVELDLNGHTIVYDQGTPLVSGVTWNIFLRSDTSTSGVHFFKYNVSGQVKIYNGVIRQGANNGSGDIGIGFNPICINEGSVDVGWIKAEWKGSAVGGIHNNDGVLYAHDNILVDRGTGIVNRSQGVRSIYSDRIDPNGFVRNLVRRSRHQGIMHKNDGGPISWNEVYVDSWATNGYGVNAAVDVSYNKIYGTGYHMVAVGFLGIPTMACTGNFIYLQGEAPSLRDTEYGLDASVIGVRLSHYSGDTSLYSGYTYASNCIIVKGRDGTLSVRGAQIATSPYISGTIFNNNYVKCEMQDATTRGACIAAQGTNNEFSPTEIPATYDGNTLLSNDALVRFGDQYAVGGQHVLQNNTFTKFGNRSNFKTVRIGYQDRNSYGNVFIDNTFNGCDLNVYSFEGVPGGIRDYVLAHATPMLLWDETYGEPLQGTDLEFISTYGTAVYTSGGDGMFYPSVHDTTWSCPANSSTVTKAAVTQHRVVVDGYLTKYLSAGDVSARPPTVPTIRMLVSP